MTSPHPPIWPPPQVEIHDSLAAMDLDPDLALLEAWRQGDRAAANKLIEKHYHLIRRNVVNKTPEGAADDIVGDVLLALVESRDRFRAGATFKTYALKITFNVICDYYRRRKPLDAADVLHSSVRQLGGGPVSRLLAQEKDRVLLEALRSLELQDQHILELFYWEDLSGPELSLVFECPEPTIRGRLRRAKERLEAQIAAIERDHRQLEDTVTDLDAWVRKLRDELQPYLGRLTPPEA